MDAFTSADVKNLLKEAGKPCVSLYLPTHPGGAEQDPIQLKNLLTEADARLVAYGMRSAEAGALLRPAAELLEDHSFWKQSQAGLACFLSPQSVRRYRLPKPVGPLVTVSNLFAVKPLLAQMREGWCFYVLAMSQKRVRLWLGDASGLEEVDVKSLPANLEEALRFHDRDEPLMFHTRPAGGGWAAIFSGQGVGIDTHKNDLLLYFQKIDQALHPFLRQENKPLVLAAVEYLWPIYRQANTYPHLAEHGVAGNPDHWSPRELHDNAWGIVGPGFERPKQEALALFGRLAGAERRCSDPREVIEAACQGKLQTLFVASDRPLWGVVDPVADAVEIHGACVPGDEDLLNVAAIRTYLAGGTVYVVPAADVPGDRSQAGIYWLPMDKHGKPRGRD